MVVVGYIGNTGNCFTGGNPVTPEQREAGLGTHLHLTVYKTDVSDYTLLWSGENYVTTASMVVDPFNHTEKRRIQ